MARFTQAQIDWARSHDWYVDVEGDASDASTVDSIIVEDAFMDTNVEPATLNWSLIHFTDFRKLKEWAGY